MRRNFFRAASFLSAILFAIAVALWVRGYFATDSLHASYHAHPYLEPIVTKHGRSMEYLRTDTTVANGRGCIELKTESCFGSDRPIPQIAVERGLSGASDLRLLSPRFSWLGVEHAVDSSIKSESIRIPTWMIVLAFLLLPLWREGRRFAKRRRSHMNRCEKCGYNLTGNTSGTCPECGTAISNALQTRI